MPFRFDHPALLWLLLLAAPVVWLGMRSLAVIDRGRRWTAIALRVAVLVVLTLMLAGLQTVRWHSDLAVVAVIDQSESIRRFAHAPSNLAGSDTEQATGETIPVDEWVRRWVKRASTEKKPDDRFGLVTFDGRASVRSLPSSIVSLDAGAVETPTEGSAIGDSIRQAIATLPPDAAKRLFLASDGNENISTAAGPRGSGGEPEGSDLIAAAYEARAAGVPIDVLPIEYHVGREVMVQGIYAPTEARAGQTVAVRVVLRATAPAAGTLYLKHDGEPVNLGAATGGAAVSEKQWTTDNEADSASGRFVCVRMVELPMAYAGPNHYSAVFEPSDPAADAIAANNQAQAFTLVHGKGRVLFADNLGGASGDVLPATLTDHGMQIDKVSARDLPGSLAELQRYDAVVLQSVPAEAVTPAQQKMLARYVNELGGGLVMIGGPDSFGAGGWTNTPIDRILPVDCRVPNQTVLPSGALVLVIDHSGSMGEGLGPSGATKQEVANEAAVQAIATLYPQDMVGVVIFDATAEWVVPLRMNIDPGSSAAIVRKVVPAGGTDIYPGLVEAYNALAPLEAQDAAVKHVILLTDGQSSAGDYAGIILKMRAAGITLSTVGVGADVDTALLTMLAQQGGGAYHPVTDAGKLPQIFIKEARSIRKNLIKEKPFRPQLVATGSPITAGLREVPVLKGLVLTGPRQDPRVLMPLVGPEGEPVFAHWQVGLGRTAAFTSDATNRWAAAWLNWGGYADFWLRTLRAIGRPADSRDFDLIATVRNDTLHLRLDAAGADVAEHGGASPNFLKVGGSILGPDGTIGAVTLHQTGPGIYEGATPAPAQGSYIVSLFVEDSTGQRRAVFGGAVRPPGLELRDFSSNRAILEQVAQITGGRVLNPLAPEPGTIFNRDSILPSRSIRPLWRPLMICLLALFLLDVACRRIAWDLGAVMSFFRGLLGAAGTRGEQAEATMAALKTRAARFRTTDTTTGRPAPAVAAAPTTARKFEAAADTESADDLTEALGGAAAAETSAALAASVKRVPREEPATTSRLLDAKRRARERLNDDQS